MTLRYLGKYQKSQVNTRELSKQLNFSIGKLNYCLKELQKKGLIKIKNFKKNKKKLNYFYLLTPKGVSKKTIPINFLKNKMIDMIN